jgi:energy-coupling factor transporter transmembrane protein EcfT
MPKKKKSHVSIDYILSPNIQNPNTNFPPFHPTILLLLLLIFIASVIISRPLVFTFIPSANYYRSVARIFFRKTFCKYSSATISIQPHPAFIVIFVIVTYQQQVQITPFHKQISITSANSMVHRYSSNADNYSASQEVTGFSVT